MKLSGAIFFFTLLMIPFVGAQTPEEQKKIEEIRAKRDRGEQLTPEDRAFVQRMTALRNQQGGGGPNPQRAAQIAEWAKTHPPRESTGLIPMLLTLASGRSF